MGTSIIPAPPGHAYQHNLDTGECTRLDRQPGNAGVYDATNGSGVRIRGVLLRYAEPHGSELTPKPCVPRTTPLPWGGMCTHGINQPTNQPGARTRGALLRCAEPRGPTRPPHPRPPGPALPPSGRWLGAFSASPGKVRIFCAIYLPPKPHKRSQFQTISREKKVTAATLPCGCARGWGAQGVPGLLIRGFRFHTGA